MLPADYGMEIWKVNPTFPLQWKGTANDLLYEFLNQSIKLLGSSIALYGLPEKRESDWLIFHEFKKLCLNENIEVAYNAPRIQNGTGAVKRAFHAVSRLLVIDSRDKHGLEGIVNFDFRVMSFIVHSGWKIHHLRYMMAQNGKPKQSAKETKDSNRQRRTYGNNYS